MSDDELQNRLEGGEHIAGKDALAYRKVFDALGREPDFRLPVNFADAVMGRITSRKESRREYFLIGGGVLFFVIAAAVVFFDTGFTLGAETFRLQADLSAFRFVKDYLGLFFFGIVLIAFLQWVDKRFVRQAGKRVNDLSL